MGEKHFSAERSAIDVWEEWKPIIDPKLILFLVFTKENPFHVYSDS